MKELLQHLNSNDLPAIILDNAFDGIVCYLPILSPLGKITNFELIYINNAALNILPGNKEEYIGKRFLSLFPYSLKNGLFEEMKKSFRSGERSEHMYYFETSTKNWWSQNSIVKYDGGLVVYSRDVTEKKKLELEVERRNADLQTLMREIHHRVKNNLQIISSMLYL